jgi:hypothetical protein
MKLIPTYDFNQKVFSQTYQRMVIISNIKIETHGNLITNKNGESFKHCTEMYEIKFRDPSIMRYEWVDVDDLVLR